MTTFEVSTVVPEPRRPWDHSRGTLLRVGVLVTLSGIFGWLLNTLTGDARRCVCWLGTTWLESGL